MKCSNKDCKNVGEFAPKICIPAVGHPAVLEETMQMICGLVFCRRHCEALDPLELVPDLEKIATVGAEMNYKTRGGYYNPPDMNRTWILPIRIDSEEYKNFLKVSEKRKGN